MNTTAATVCRWLARVVGLAPLLFVAAYVAKEGVPDLSAASSLERTLFTCMFTALAGFVVLWRWELVGGLLSVVATTAFYAVHLAGQGSLPGGAFPLFFAPGLLAIAAWRLSRPAPPYKTHHGKRAASATL